MHVSHLLKIGARGWYQTLMLSLKRLEMVLNDGVYLWGNVLLCSEVLV